MWTGILFMFGLTLHLSNSWTITNAVTKVEITPQHVKITSNLKLNSPEPKGKILFSVPDDNVASISASTGNGKLPLQKVEDKYSTWEIDLLEIASAAEVSVTYYYTSLVKPLKATIETDLEQTWEFIGNVNVFSPYVAQKQETIIQATGKQLNPEPAYNVAPFTSRIEKIRFRDGSPLVYIPSATREILISNWGKIHVRDSVVLENRATVSKKPFSRLKRLKNSLESWTVYLPKVSENIGYRDLLGLIHTFSTRLMSDATEVQLQARYPILAGWKTDYQLSHDLPAHEYLTTNGTQFCLDINAMDPFLESVVIEDLILKITLPEGSKYEGESKPDGFVQLSNQWMYASFDTLGRLVLVFKKKNLIDGAGGAFQMCYANKLNSFSRVAMTGIRVSFYIFTLLVSCAVVNHFKE